MHNTMHEYEVQQYSHHDNKEHYIVCNDKTDNMIVIDKNVFK